MTKKKGITLRDILSHIQGLRGSLEGRLDRVESRLGNVENRLGNVEQRVTNIDERLQRMEISLVPSHQRLQLTVRAHGERKRKLERKTGLVAA